MGGSYSTIIYYECMGLSDFNDFFYSRKEKFSNIIKICLRTLF